MERKAKLDSDRRASEAKKAEADTQRNAKALEKKEADSEQRAKGKQTQGPAARGDKGKQDTKEQDGTNNVERVQKGKGKAD